MATISRRLRCAFAQLGEARSLHIPLGVTGRWGIFLLWMKFPSNAALPILCVLVSLRPIYVAKKTINVDNASPDLS